MKNNIVKFILKNDTLIKITKTDIIFSRGVINFKKIIIDKEQSEPKFIDYINKLVNEGQIEIDEEDFIFEDFKTLESLGYIRRKVDLNNRRILIIVGEEFEYYKNNIQEMEGVDIISANKVIDDKIIQNSLKIVDENTKEKQFEKIVSTNKLYDYQYMIIVDSYYNAERIRFFNKLIYYLDIYGIFAISDSDMFFLTMFSPRETGCFECLENQLVEKLKIIDQLSEKYPKRNYLDYTDKFLKLGFLMNVVSQIIYEGYTDLLGNVLIFNKNNYEYRFDSNRIQVSCSTCSTQANVFHEEQNIKTINILNNL